MPPLASRTNSTSDRFQIESDSVQKYSTPRHGISGLGVISVKTKTLVFNRARQTAYNAFPFQNHARNSQVRKLVSCRESCWPRTENQHTAVVGTCLRLHFCASAQELSGAHTSFCHQEVKK